jgi:hypothetical protein
MPINTGSLGEQENILFIDFGFGDILMTKGRDEDSLYQNQLLFSKGRVRNIGEESNDHEGLTSDHIPNLKMVMRFANPESITAFIHSLSELQKEVFLLNNHTNVQECDARKAEQSDTDGSQKK